MTLLLDTHALLWFLAGDARMPVAARELVSDPGNAVLVSAGSLWEIAIKAGLGKLTLAAPFEALFPARLVAERIEVLPIGLPHLARLLGLPHHHRDPFDRLVAAQSLSEGLPLLSRDPAFDAYGVRRVWAEMPRPMPPAS